MRQRWYDARLVPAALATWLMTVLLTAWQPSQIKLAGFIGAAIVIASVFSWPHILTRGSRGTMQRWDGARWQVSTCMAISVLVSASWWWHSDAAVDDIIANTKQHSESITVRVQFVSQPKIYSSQQHSAEPLWYADARAHIWLNPDFRPRASQPVTVFAAGDPAEWLSWYEITGGMSRRGLGGSQVLIFADELHALKPAPQWTQWSQRVRSATLHAVRDLTDVGRALIPGVAIGDTSNISTELDVMMKASGLTHLTAVSGSHFAIVTTSLWFMLGCMLVPVRVRAFLVAVFLTCLVILVRPEPSVIRSAAMAAIAVFAVLLGRGSQAIPSLSAGVIVLVIVEPSLAIDIGFALSVSATVGLVVLAPILEDRVFYRLAAPLRSQCAIAVAAQVLCAPVLIFISPNFLTWSALANLVAAPASALLTVLSVSVAVFAVPLPFLAEKIGYLAQLPAWWIGYVAQITTSLPGAQLNWISGMAGVVLLAVALVALVVAVMSAPGLLGYLRTSTAPVIRFKYGRLRQWQKQRRKPSHGIRQY